MKHYMRNGKQKVALKIAPRWGCETLFSVAFLHCMASALCSRCKNQQASASRELKFQPHRVVPNCDNAPAVRERVFTSKWAHDSHNATRPRALGYCRETKVSVRLARNAEEWKFRREIAKPPSPTASSHGHDDAFRPFAFIWGTRRNRRCINPFEWLLKLAKLWKSCVFLREQKKIRQMFMRKSTLGN